MLHSGCVKRHQKFRDFVGLPMGLLRDGSPKNRMNTGLFGSWSGEVRSEGCTSCSPVLQALIIFQTQLYGSASAEPFFVAPFPENWGARLRISGGCPARGEPEALTKLCSSIACRAQPCQRCSPVLQALIIFQMQLYGSASAEPFFAAPFPENGGARLRISGGCPARGEPEALLNPCSSIAC